MNDDELDIVLAGLTETRPCTVVAAVQAAHRARQRIALQCGDRKAVWAARATLELQLIAAGGLALLGR